jgi:hypothetical protein
MSRHAELRARFVALHGERRTARAELLGILGAARIVWEGAELRRAEAEAVFFAAWSDEQARPAYVQPPWSGGPQREFPRTFRGRSSRWFAAKRHASWRADTWRALAALALASAREAEWGDQVATLAAKVAQG